MSEFDFPSYPLTSDQVIAETPVVALLASRTAYSRQRLLAFRDLVLVPADQSAVSVAVGASRESIEAMPRVIVTDEGTECTICLEDFKVRGEAKEMPCMHRFHSHCIENWLQMRASCPLCRFTMPIEGQTNSMSTRLRIDIIDFGEIRDNDLNIMFDEIDQPS